MFPRPSPKVAIFITIIVKFPIVQIVTMVLGFFMIALEYPLPVLKGTVLYRSIVLRVVLLVLLSFVAVLFYQVSHLSLAAFRANMIDNLRERMRLCGL